MNAEQKRAWLAVATMTVCVVGYIALIPFFGPVVAGAAFGFYGINGFGAFIGRKERTDERDKSIARRATLAGAMLSYLAFILGCMGVWAFEWHVQGKELVSAIVLPSITMVGAVVFFFARSVAILVLYGRHMEADNA